MSRSTRWLWIALVVQALLVLWFSQGGVELGAYASKDTVLGLTSSDFDRVVIQDPDGKAVTLVRKENRWLLPEANDFPAAVQKTGDVLSKLVTLTKSWPVAATDIAAKQLKVSANVFEKKIVFYQGDQEKKTLFIGTSPSYRKVHARLNGESPVYVVNFSSFDATTKLQDWYDRDLLHVSKSKILGLQLAGMALEKKNDIFQPVALTAEQEPNEGEINSLVTKVTGINYEELLGKEEKPDYGLSEPVLEVLLQLDNKESLTYRFGKLKDAEGYVLKSSALPYYFKVGKDVVEGLTAVAAEKLVRPKGSAAAEKAAKTQAVETTEPPEEQTTAANEIIETPDVGEADEIDPGEMVGDPNEE